MSVESARHQVLQTCIELADRGYLAGTGGNVAVRVDAEHFAITPSALDYYAMSAEDIGIIRVSDATPIEGRRPASVESGLHAALLRVRPEVHASLHTHQPVASAYGLLGEPLVVGDAERRRLLGKVVPCVEYAPSGTAWLAMRVGDVFETGHHVCLMRNHGIVCVGRDAERAAQRVEALESECAAQLLDGLADGLPSSVKTLVSSRLRESLETPKAER